MKKFHKYFTFKKFLSIFVSACLLLSTSFLESFAAQEPLKDITASVFKEKVVSFPFASAKIGDSKYFGKKNLVINIQDLHANPSAQYNIAKILEYIDKKFKIGGIYLEGGIGKVDVSWIDSVKEKNKKEGLLDSLMNSGQMTGAEYFAIKNSRNIIKGLEDAGLYEKNIERLSYILSNRQYADNTVDAVSSAIESLKQMYLSGESKKILELVYNHNNGFINDKAYYSEIKKLASKKGIPTEQIDKYLAISEIFKTIDEKKTIKEFRLFLTEMRHSVSYRDYSVIVETLGSNNDLYELSSYIASLPQFNNNNYPNIYKTASLSALIGKSDLMSVMNNEQNTVYELLYLSAASKAEREILFLSQQFSRFSDYISGRITAEDLRIFESNKNDFIFLLDKYTGLGSGLKESVFAETLDSYYKDNLKRDKVFYKNIFGTEPEKYGKEIFEFEVKNDSNLFFEALEEGTQVKVVITGGFHTKGLTDIFKDNEISYIVLTPSVGDLSSDYDNIYNNYVVSDSQQIQNNALALKPYAQRIAGIKTAEIDKKITKDYLEGKLLAAMQTGYTPKKVSQYINKASSEAGFNAELKLVDFDGDTSYFKYFVEEDGKIAEFGVKYQKSKAKVEAVRIDEIDARLAGKTPFLISEKTKETVRKRIADPIAKLLGINELSRVYRGAVNVISFFAAPLLEAFTIFSLGKLTEEHPWLTKENVRKHRIAVFVTAAIIDAVVLALLPVSTAAVIIGAALLGTVPAHFIVNSFELVWSGIKNLFDKTNLNFFKRVVTVAFLGVFMVSVMTSCSWFHKEEPPVVETGPVKSHYIEGIESVKIKDYQIIVTDINGQEIDYELFGACYSTDKFGLNFIESFERDLELAKSLGLNSFRTYNPLAVFNEDGTIDYERTEYMLDRLAEEGMTVSVGFDIRRHVLGGYDEISKQNYPGGTHLEYIEHFKDHPAILMWIFGNEYNYNYDAYFGQYGQTTWYKILRDIVRDVKAIDPDRLVGSVHGGLPTASEVNSYEVADIDIIMLNVYNGDTFGDVFEKWQELVGHIKIPIVFSEYGRSSMNPDGTDQENLQAKFVNNLMGEIDSEIDNIGAGGYIFELVDEHWKGFKSYSGNIGMEAMLGLFYADGTPKAAAHVVSQKLDGTLPYKEIDLDVNSFRPSSPGVPQVFEWVGKEWPEMNASSYNWRSNVMNLPEHVAVDPDSTIRITLSLGDSKLQNPKFKVQLLDTFTGSDANTGIYPEVFEFEQKGESFTIEIPASAFESQGINLQFVKSIVILSGKEVFFQDLNSDNSTTVNVESVELAVVDQQSADPSTMVDLGPTQEISVEWVNNYWPKDNISGYSYRSNSINFPGVQAMLDPDSDLVFTWRGTADTRYRIQLVETGKSNETDDGLLLDYGTDVNYGVFSGSEEVVRIPVKKFQEMGVNVYSIQSIIVHTGKNTFNYTLNFNNNGTVDITNLTFQMYSVGMADGQSASVPENEGEGIKFKQDNNLAVAGTTYASAAAVTNNLARVGSHAYSMANVNSHLSGMMPLGFLGLLMSKRAKSSLNTSSYISAGKRISLAKLGELEKEGLNPYIFMKADNDEIKKSAELITAQSGIGRLAVGDSLFDVYAKRDNGVLSLYFDGEITADKTENDVYLAMGSWIRDNENVRKALKIRSSFNMNIFDVQNEISRDLVVAASKENPETIFIKESDIIRNGTLSYVFNNGLRSALTLLSGMIRVDKRNGKYKKPAVFAITFDSAEALTNEEVIKTNAESSIDTIVVRDISNRSAANKAAEHANKYGIRLIYEINVSDSSRFIDMKEVTELGLDGIRINARIYTGDMKALSDWILSVHKTLKQNNENSITGLIAPASDNATVFNDEFSEKTGILNCKVFTPAELTQQQNTIRGRNTWVIVDTEAGKKSEIRSLESFEPAVEKVAESDIAMLDISQQSLSSLDTNKNRNSLLSFLNKIGILRNAAREISPFERGKNTGWSIREGSAEVPLPMSDILARFVRYEVSRDEEETISSAKRIFTKMGIKNNIVLDNVADKSEYVMGVLEGFLEANASSYIDKTLEFNKKDAAAMQKLAVKYIVDTQKLTMSEETNLRALRDKVHGTVNMENVPEALLSIAQRAQATERKDGTAKIKELINEFNDEYESVKASGNKDAQKLIAVNMLRLIDMIANDRVSIGKDFANMSTLGNIRGILTAA